MTTTTIDVSTVPPMAHDEAMQLQARELERTLEALRSLDDAEWGLRTDCPAWDLRAMYRHVLGACEAGASVRENAHQLRRARAYRRRHGGPLEAALSAVQVEDRGALQGTDIVARLAAVAPRTVRGRARTPSFVRRHVHLKVDGPVEETWRLGYLIDVIYLRDLFMHRIDLHRAVGRSLELTAAHDGRIVTDVVAEWARRHGEPFVLDLHGTAGGSYTGGAVGATTERQSLDAVEFCRTLAGRAPASGLLSTVVPF
jgi:uncharacterized protein (TIGR03083 family)